MKKRNRIYSPLQLVSAMIMVVALLWLTVSLPFVYSAQQQAIEWNSGQCQEEDPFANTTEEKAPAASVSEEYLHDHHDIFSFFTDKLNHNHRHSYDVYIAFHGELISPPPDGLLS